MYYFRECKCRLLNIDSLCWCVCVCVCIKFRQNSHTKGCKNSKYNLVSSGVWTNLWNHNHNQDRKHIHPPNLGFLLYLCNIFINPLSSFISRKQLTCFLSSQISFHFLEFDEMDYIACTDFGYEGVDKFLDSFTRHNILRLIHTVIYINSVFLFTAE